MVSQALAWLSLRTLRPWPWCLCPNCGPSASSSCSSSWVWTRKYVLCKMYSWLTLRRGKKPTFVHCTWCVSFPHFWLVCGHGGGDDIHHRYVSQSNAQVWPTGTLPPPLLPHMLPLSTGHGHRGQSLVLFKVQQLSYHDFISSLWQDARIWNMTWSWWNHVRNMRLLLCAGRNVRVPDVWLLRLQWSLHPLPLRVWNRGTRMDIW